MKILQYCQHVLGVGHFFRSIEIAKAMSPHRVLFVQGGKPVTNIDTYPHITHHFLPPLMMDSNFKSFTVDASHLEKIKQNRKGQLLQVVKTFKPDVLIIELFPFGRKKFSFELLPLLEYVKEKSKTTLVVCSLRDILVEKEDQQKYENRVINILNNFFDLLLVHSDPNVIKLDETFTSIEKIKIPIEYTGYVTRNIPGIELLKPPVDYTRIVVSHGGGNVGFELLEAAIAASELLDENYIFDIFPGVFISPSNLAKLHFLASTKPNIHIKQFTNNFIAELAQSHLSISMAGYNTMMDLLASRTPGLVYPFTQNREQMLRAKKFAEVGIVKIIETPNPIEIASTIDKIKDRKISFKYSIDTDGARKTKKLIEQYNKKRRRN